MSILHRVNCPVCEKEFSIESQHVGQRFECPSCSCVFQTNIHGVDGSITSSLDSHYFEFNESRPLNTTTTADTIGSILQEQEEEPEIDDEVDSIPITLSASDQGAIEGLVGISTSRKPKTNVKRELKRLTLPSTRRVIQYFKLRYSVNNLDVKGKKQNLIEKLIAFLTSVEYKDAAFVSCNTTPAAINQRINVRSSTPVELTSPPRQGADVLLTCPKCQTQLRLQLTDPLQNIACPSCPATFKINFNRETQCIPEPVDFFDGAMDDVVDLSSFKPTFTSISTGSREYLCYERKKTLADLSVDEKEKYGVVLMRSLGFSTVESLFALRRSNHHLPRALVFALGCLDGGDLQQSAELGQLQVNRRLKTNPEELDSFDRFVLPSLLSTSFLLEPDFGCRVLQNIVFLLGDLQPRHQMARQKAWMLIYRLLQLEEQVLLRYADSGCFYLKKVAAELEKAIVVRKGTDRQQLYEIPVAAIQHEIRKMYDIVYKSQGVIPKDVLYGYVMGCGESLN